MSRVSEVIKNKNKVEKLRRGRRRDEMTNIRQESAFKVRLYDELKKVDMLLESGEVDSVVIEVEDEFIAKFGIAIYSEDLADYAIVQVDGHPNRFSIERRFISY